MIIGVALALATSLLATLSGLVRERGFWPTILIVVASYDTLFAVMEGNATALHGEAALLMAFIAAALAGFRSSPWIVVAGLVVHGMLDVLHGRLIANAGIPPWWPDFCLGFDVAAAACLATSLIRPIAAARHPED